MSHAFLATGLVALLSVLAGCVTNIAAQSEPATLKPLTHPRGDVVLDADVNVSLRPGYSVRRLRAGERWMPAGDIDQGRTYRSVNSVFMVNSGHLHEAHLVISSGRIIGVFLPVESAFVSAADPQPFPAKELNP